MSARQEGSAASSRARSACGSRDDEVLALLDLVCEALQRRGYVVAKVEVEQPLQHVEVTPPRPAQHRRSPEAQR
jgi:hypothetical protein